ncbi:hypothetical protein [Thalassobius sp. I31.1]|uniref:hypothetical protein n=1 Tax=Thalassobius sp. I31.1 TaxID=2109912 RepID=UPI000D1A67F7|nr:hypothetical protein [Thalassobius sp. I31.1]
MSSKSHRKLRKRADFPRVWDLSRRSVWSALRYARGPLENLPLPDSDGVPTNVFDWPMPVRPGMYLDDDLIRAIVNVLRMPARSQMYRLYEILLQPWFLREPEVTADRLRRHPAVAPEPLARLSKFLIYNAPDRHAVLYGLSWLSLCQDPEAEELAGFLGQHEFFMTEAIPALQENAADPEIAIWGLAQQLKSYGRIRTVNLLLKTDKPEIMKWLLLEGFRNRIAHEYLSLQVALAGDLISALRNPGVEHALIDAATDIFLAFFDGGLTMGWSGYPDGEEAFALWLEHVGKTLDEKQHRLVEQMCVYLKEKRRIPDVLPWSDQAVAETLKRCEALLA